MFKESEFISHIVYNYYQRCCMSQNSTTGESQNQRTQILKMDQLKNKQNTKNQKNWLLDSQKYRCIHS
jgi:hypothetical protein